MTTKGLAFKYVAGQLRGDKDDVSYPDRSGAAVRLGHYGAYLAMHSDAPNSVEAYEAWFQDVKSDDARAKPKVNGAKLRRAVLMRRDGRTWDEVRRAVGCSSINEWVSKLPDDLKP